MGTQFKPFCALLLTCLIIIFLILGLVTPSTEAAAGGKVKLEELKEPPQRNKISPPRTSARAPSRSPSYYRIMTTQIRDGYTGQHIPNVDLIVKGPHQTIKFHLKRGGAVAQNGFYFNFEADVPYTLELHKAGYESLAGIKLYYAKNKSSWKLLNATMHPSPTGHISITVLDHAAKAAIYGTTVTLKGPSGTVRKTISKDEKVAVFYNMPAGPYSYTIQSPNYQAQTGTMTLSKGEYENIVKYLKPGAAKLRVRVTSDKGPVPGASVQAMGSGKAQVSARTNDKGVAELNLSSGKYTILATAPNHQSLSQPTVTLPHSGILEIKLKDLTRHRVRVRVSSDQYGRLPLANVKASAGKIQLEAQTKNNGMTELNLPSGKYTVVVSAPNHQSSKPASITVPYSGTIDFKLKYLTPKLRVRVSNERGPVGGAMVRAGAAGKPPVTAYTNSAGVAFLQLAPGKYSISLWARNHVIEPQPGVTVPHSGTLELKLKYQNPNTATLRFRILEARNSEPLKDAQVTLNGPGGQRKTKTRYDTGYATFGNLMVGTYRYTIHKKGYKTSTGTIQVSQARIIGHTAKLERLAAEPDPNLRLAELRVKIKSSQKDQVIKYAKIDIFGEKNKRFSKSANSGPAGTAEFTRVPPGKYSCRVTHHDYETRWVTIDVNQKMTQETIKLKRKVNNYLQVKVIDKNGRPVSGAKVVVTYKKRSSFGSRKKKATVTTNASGMAMLQIKPYRAVTISASKSGHLSGQWSRRKGTDVPQIVHVRLL